MPFKAIINTIYDLYTVWWGGWRNCWFSSYML